MPAIINIRSDKPGAAGILSNFFGHQFTFDGVLCESMEGFLNALKFPSPVDQRKICALVGLDAKMHGGRRNSFWQARQTLWWQETSYDRHSAAYQTLLNKAYAALATNPYFAEVLTLTNDAILRHDIGQSDPRKTVLTIEEFLSRLYRLRAFMSARRVFLTSPPTG